jgi:hypothetical protein
MSMMGSDEEEEYYGALITERAPAEEEVHIDL